MRASQILIPTLRDDPADVEVASHRLMLRAGLIRRVASGMFTWLPLGLRVLHKVEGIVREEMNRAGAQEILMPVIQPASLWKQTGRWQAMGPELMRMKDRLDREYCVSPTHEEVVTDLFRQVVTSYRQLPCNLYHIGTKFRDEIRPRFGLLRAREFIMKDAYSFHLDERSFDEAYQAMYDAYGAILDRLGLRYRAVDADSGAIGDGYSHEFHVLADAGEDEIVYTENGGYAANIERAPAPAVPTSGSGESGPMEKIATPGVKTIEDLCRSVASMQPSETVKTLFLNGTDSPVALVLRGDHELNLAKVAKLPGIEQPADFASEAAIRECMGCSFGSLGPVGLAGPLYVDRSAALLGSFACGANVDGFHFVNAMWERDASPGTVVDIRRVAPGEPAPNGEPLKMQRGIEVGHVFQLGSKYTKSMGVEMQDGAGNSVVPVMGCYGFGVTRVVAAIVEQCHDERGVLWPSAVAPAQVHIVSLATDRKSDVARTSDSIYKACMQAGVEALLDDRKERPGVKFNDADLLGLPHRLIVGERALKEGFVEFSSGRGATVRLDPEDAVARLRR